jgi:dsDNA-specific endonuclease/ATPase MutS2
MSSPKKRKMVALKVLETSGVDHPAHLEEGWIVMKSATKEANVSEEVLMDPSLEEAYIERVVELEKALEASNAQVEKLEKAYEDMAKEDEEEVEDDEEEDMMKSLPQPVREMLEKAANEANYAKEELRKEREARRDEEFVQKAAAWSHLTVDAKDLGPALRRLTDIDANLASQVEKALSAANAQSESAAIFDEIGRGSRPDDGSAYAKVESMAKAAVNNGDFKTMEQAVASIVTQNPDLYAAYRAEQR